MYNLIVTPENESNLRSLLHKTCSKFILLSIHCCPAIFRGQKYCLFSCSLQHFCSLKGLLNAIQGLLVNVQEHFEERYFIFKNFQGSGKFAKDFSRPVWIKDKLEFNLSDNIIQARFKAGCCLLRGWVLYVRKLYSEGELGCNEGQRISAIEK